MLPAQMIDWAAHTVEDHRCTLTSATRILGQRGQAEHPAPPPEEHPQKEVMTMRRGFRLTITWTRGSVAITLEPH